MSYDLNRIKEISILSIAHKLNIEVKRNNKAICYNGHDSKTPSLSFNDKKGFYKCFGCNEKGDNIELVQNSLKLDFNESCQWIQNAFNLSSVKNVPVKTVSKRSVSQKVEVVFSANPEIYSWLIGRLSLSDESRTYLKSRGFNDALIDSLKIKDYNPSSNFFQDLISTWSREQLICCGLVKLTESGLIKLIWWDRTILFPFLNSRSEVEYIQGRRLGNDDPKYLNLKGVAPTLYNQGVLSRAKKGSKLIICEGITDTISGIQLGFSCVGVLGASGFKSEWSKLFLDFEIFVLPDNDSGGQTFFHDLSIQFAKVGKSIRRVNLPKSNDLNDYINDK